MRLILLCLVFTCLQASGQIVLRINDAPPVTIAAGDLAKLPRHTAVLDEHGTKINYEGPLLHDVLAQAGVDFGKELRGKQLSTYVAALASDGYEVVYALAEFDPTIVDSGIIWPTSAMGRRSPRLRGHSESLHRTINDPRGL